MKPIRRTASASLAPGDLELYDLRLDNLVRIERRGPAVVIRAARDNVPSPTKAAFVRYLATEGFLPREYAWSAGDLEASGRALQWVTDGSWVRFNHRFNRLAVRAWNHLTWGKLVGLGLFLAAFSAALWLRYRYHWY